MREYKFRGRKLNSSEFVYGSLLISEQVGTLEPLHYHISPLESNGIFRVDPETIGQYTGLKDINDKEIYDGDLVLCTEVTEDEEVAYTSEVMWVDDGFIIYDYFEIEVSLSIFTKPRKYLPYYKLEVTGDVYEIPTETVDEVDLIVQGLVTK